VIQHSSDIDEDGKAAAYWIARSKPGDDSLA
jgi:hypothetical protein